MAQLAIEPKTEVLTPVKKSSPLEGLKPLLNARGEVDLESMDFSARIQQFAEFSEKANCNLVLLEQNILSQMPKGASLLPMVIIPTLQDAWRGADAKKMQLKEGMVEPSAEFLIRLGNLLGIKTVKIHEGVVDMAGVAMYSARYNAYLTLPSGETLSVEDEGKDQALYNSNGVQAHIVESTRKKAKRNAIWALLGIPKTMDEKMFDRPWVAFRPIFRPESEEARAIIADKKALSDQSTSLLFNRPALAISQDSGADFNELIKAVEAAKTKEDLNAVKKRINAARINSDERAQLGATYKARVELLSTGEVTQPTAQQAAEVGGY